jgi:two-component system cell cycle sensor histidine kinase/response regulator CckA
MITNETLSMKELTQRLAEAEATITALLSGQIDAVVDPETRTPVLLAKAQDALREERDRAQRYLDAPDIILLAMDLERRVTLVNRYACSVLGWSGGELIGRDFADTCLPVRIRDEMKAKFPELIAGEFTVLENPILTKAGHERLIGWRNTLLRDDAGNVTGVLSSGSDITESRGVETALRTSAAELLERTKMLEEHSAALSDQAALLDLAQDAIIVRDMNNRIVFWSRGAQAMYGWASHEALGRDKEQLLSTAFSEASDTIEATLMREGRWEGEALQSTRDGRPVTVLSRWALQRAADGTPLRILTINTDITERKHADGERARLVEDLQGHALALRRNEERTTYALGAARMGLWELDTVSGDLWWSPTMGAAFGLRPEQAPTKAPAFFTLIHPDDRQMVATSLGQAGLDGTDFKEEFRVVWPDGSAHWIAGRARMLPAGPDGSPHWLGVGLDIGDRKALEAQFRQAQKMEAVGQLAGGVAHDFNNLLTSILGYSGFVMDTFGPQDHRRADMDEVVKAGQRAAGLTRQLLAFSRKQVLQPTRLNLNTLVTGMHPMLSRLIGEQVELISSLAPDLSTVRADPGQLEQVLMNLVVNARDAMPSGGRLTIQTLNVELDQSFVHDVVVRPGPYVMLAVSDTGVGMSDATKSRLFEPFFTTKEPGKGTGLGLATVYGIVKQSGGFVWVYTELGKGTSFKVYLSRADDVSDDVDHVVADHRPAVGTETLLVVEDEEAVRLLTRRVLEDANYRVFDAANPQQAEALFDKHPNVFQALVTDVIMPGSTGPQLFERLARKQPNLKVLYVSGYTDTAIIDGGQIDPAIELLQKPFSANALKRRIREVLDGS